jgi:hypothetical protein
MVEVGVVQVVEGVVQVVEGEARVRVKDHHRKHPTSASLKIQTCLYHRRAFHCKLSALAFRECQISSTCSGGLQE